MYAGQISSPCECLHQREYPVEEKIDRHEAIWIEEGGFHQTNLRLVTIGPVYSDMYLAHWNRMELWKVVFENETICKFK